MTETEAIKLFKALADKSRLQILKSLAIEEMYVERLAQRLDLTPATISFHLKKLSDAGAVTGYKSQYYTMFRLNREVLNTGILSLILEKSDEADAQAARDAARAETWQYPGEGAARTVDYLLEKLSQQEKTDGGTAVGQKHRSVPEEIAS